jgi:hypothetical protein
MKKLTFTLIIFLSITSTRANYVFIPMDDGQTDHLKAYGVAYRVLELNDEIFWMLNYRGGAFMFKYRSTYEDLMLARNVSYELITDGQSTNLISQLSDPDVNQNPMKLEKAPKIAVYSPPGMQPWDDAVTMVLTYSEIPYDTIYDTEVIGGLLPTYNWLHLHHEDFTGQYGKFWSAYKNDSWYQEQVRSSEILAKKLGFNKVSELKLGVAKKIRDYVAGGGYLFAMCSATDSYDISLAAEGIDICETPFDGDPMDQQSQAKLDFTKCFAFKDFTISTNPSEYEYSNIDMTTTRNMQQKFDFFTLFEFSAKADEVPTMLTQNHESVIKGFLGQTTAFNKKLLKSNVVILGENKQANEVRYMHGTFGKGFWTFYGGHDPEDYQHRVGDEPTDLSLHPNSSGYRLILNNVLFPAAKKKEQKT